MQIACVGGQGDSDIVWALLHPRCDGTSREILLKALQTAF